MQWSRASEKHVTEVKEQMHPEGGESVVKGDGGYAGTRKCRVL